MINTNLSLNSSQLKDVNSTRAQEVKAIKEEYTAVKEKQFSQIMSEVQSLVSSISQSFEVQYQDFQDFLAEVGYEGKAIADLSQEEAAELVSEDGFFGVSQTSERIANFVISGAGGDEGRLRAGREGILQGFKEAEQMWGGKLPDIAYETINKAVEMIDKALIEGGFAVLDIEA